ncbi:MAG: single-stranded-DNA-specific exonuclease [Thermoplasmata archaeon]|jgi:hypothetical protein|nr:single-stranded-DNA-specific exonuclease [Thermoplasmata archaeon]
MALIEEAHKAARLLLDHAYVRVVARADPSAVCAAALLTHALRREHVDVHVSWARQLSTQAVHDLAQERNDALVLVGLSGDATTDDVPALHKVILDAGPTTLQGSAVLAEGGVAAMAHLVGVAVSKRNLDLAPLALAGALASWADVGGLKGLEAQILAEAREGGVLSPEPALSLRGATLVSALASQDAPFVAGITGRARNANKLVSDLRLSGDSPPSAVTGESAERLGSFLSVRLLAQEAPDAALDALYRPALRALQGPLTGLDVRDLARQAEAACAQERCGLAMAALWPDAKASADAFAALDAVREELVAALLRAERERKAEGPLVVVDAPRAGLCAPLADRVALAFAPQGSVALARHEAGAETTVALRGFAARDLGRTARHAALACGGQAWGDGRRARATLPAPEESRFRKLLAEALA